MMWSGGSTISDDVFVQISVVLKLCISSMLLTANIMSMPVRVSTIAGYTTWCDGHIVVMYTKGSKGSVSSSIIVLFNK